MTQQVKTFTGEGSTPYEAAERAQASLDKWLRETRPLQVLQVTSAAYSYQEDPWHALHLTVLSEPVM